MSKLNVSTQFEDVSRDQGQSDNQPIEHTYRVGAWDNRVWLKDLTMHMHVFIRPMHVAGLLDPNAHVEDSVSYYAFTPPQANVWLFERSKKFFAEGKIYYPQQASAELKYAGICMSPALPEKRRSIVCHMRSSMMMDNFWPDAKGMDHISFMFKLVDCTNFKRIVVSPGSVVSLDPGNMERCVQLVAIRHRERIPSTLTCGRVTGDPEKGEVSDPASSYGLTAMGVQVPVGIVTNNRYTTTFERNDEIFETEGVLCHDAQKAAENHIHALTLAI
jgi:hypothetical protein